MFIFAAHPLDSTKHAAFNLTFRSVSRKSWRHWKKFSKTGALEIDSWPRPQQTPTGGIAWDSWYVISIRGNSWKLYLMKGKSIVEVRRLYCMKGKSMACVFLAVGGAYVSGCIRNTMWMGYIWWCLKTYLRNGAPHSDLALYPRLRTSVYVSQTLVNLELQTNWANELGHHSQGCTPLNPHCWWISPCYTHFHLLIHISRIVSSIELELCSQTWQWKMPHL